MQPSLSAINRLEQRWLRKGISTAEVCRKAEIAPTSFVRWKGMGDRPPQSPRPETWERVVKAAEELLGEAA
jgi:hypothetical protein